MTARAVGTAATIAALLAAGCGSDEEQPAAATAPTTAGEATEQAAPAAKLDAKVIDAAKEEGSVLVYTNANEEQTRPIIDAFNEEHPGIEVKTLSLNGDEVVQRYLSEAASGGTTADMIMVANAIGWLSLVERGAILDYEDPTVADLPEYARLADGVVAASEDPMIAYFNKALLPEDQQPETLAELAQMAGELEGRIGTTDVSTTPQSYEATAAYLDRHGEAGWKVLEQLGKAAKVESSTGSLLTKLVQGQYAAAFLAPGSARPLLPEEAAQIVSWKHFPDATVVVPRGVGITEKAASPNAAKVFLNFVLSVKGQEAACAGGLTPYRQGVDCEFGLDESVAAVGEDKLIFGTYDEELADRRQEIVDRWNAAFGR